MAVASSAASSDQENSISDHEVLDAIQKFVPASVIPFGIGLSVPRHRITAIQLENKSPVDQAFAIYEHWKNNTDLDESAQRKQIAAALRACKQGRAAEKFVTRRGRTQTRRVLSENIVYQRLTDDDLTPLDEQKVKAFGRKLGLSSAEVENIMSKHKDDYDAVIAHTMFVEWKANCELDESTMETKFNAALSAIKHNGSPEVKFLPRAVSGTAIGDHEREPLLGGTVPPPPPPPVPPQRPPPKEATTCCTKCCWVLVALLLLLIVMESIFLVLTFTFKMEDTEVILVKDTILLPLPWWYKPPSLSLQLWGQEDTCVATVIVVKCDNIQKYTMPMSTPNIDYTYLTVGSSIVVSSIDNPNLNRPYPIWLFQTIHDAEAAAKDEFHRYNCQFPGKGVQCGQISTESSSKVIFNITQPSYYFLRCDQAPFNCSQIQHWDIIETAFNFSIPSQLILYHVVVSAQNITAFLRVRSNYFPSISSTENICLLAQLNRGGLCGSDDSKYFLALWYTSIFREMAIYGIIPIGILLIALCIVIAFQCRGKKQN